MKLQAQIAFNTNCKETDDPLSLDNCRVNNIDCTDTQFACSGNPLIQLYDIATGQLIHSWWVHRNNISYNDLQFAVCDPNLLLATTSSTGELALIGINDIRDKSTENGNIVKLSHPKMRGKMKNGQSIPLDEMSASKIEFYSAAMSGNIIAGSDKDRVYLWDLRMIREGNQIPTEMKGFHSEPINKLKFNPLHKHHLISSSEDGLMNEYDISRGGGTVIDFDVNSDDDLDDDANQGTYEQGPFLSTYPLRNSAEPHNFGIFRDEMGHFGIKGQQLSWVVTRNRALDIHKLESVTTDNDEDDSKMGNTEDEDLELCWFNEQQLGGGNMSCIECFYDNQQTKELYLLSGNTTGKLRLSAVRKGGVKILAERIGAHRAPILCGKFLSKIRCIVTGGEDNKISLWKFDPNDDSLRILEEEDEKEMEDEEDSTNVVVMNDETLFGGYTAHRPNKETVATKSGKQRHKPY